MISWRWDASNLIQQCSLPKQGFPEAPRVGRLSHQEWAFFFFFFNSQKRQVFISKLLSVPTHLVTRTVRGKVFWVSRKGDTQEVDQTESF